MSFFKIDLQEDAWLDQVFLSRNQAYGAFQIRKSYAQNALYGLGLGALIFITALTVPILWNVIKTSAAFPIPDLPVTLGPKPLTDPPKLPPTVKVIPFKPMKPTIKFTPPVITNEPVKPEDVPPAVGNTQKVNYGPRTQQGIDSPSQDIPDKGEKGAETGEPNSNEPMITVQEPAEYPGGFEALGKDVSGYLNNHYPQVAIENGISGKVYLKFVVERDGSVSDIQVIRGNELGGGLSEVAINAVKQLKKFRPGRQNGHLVRQYFMCPITFALQNNE